jgi:hypothetical protein
MGYLLKSGLPKSSNITGLWLPPAKPKWLLALKSKIDFSAGQLVAITASL